MDKFFKIQLIMLFLIIVITAIFITHNILDNKNIEKVKEENKVNRKQFAMYVKDSKDESYQEYTDSDLFPNSTKYTFNVTESYCVDHNDNLVSNVLNYVNGKVTVTSNKTIYCYLYFDGNLFDIETDIFLQSVDGSYKQVSETPTTDTNYNYSVRYDCTNNDAITSFGYNYYTHKYRIISNTKNKCNIYFEEMMSDIEVHLYIDNYEVNEIPNNGEMYGLDKEKSNCSDSLAEISFDDVNNKIKIKTSEATKCNIYLVQKGLDIQINIYVNSIEVEEIPSDGTYSLNETDSVCTNNSAIITYDDTTKKIKVKSNIQTVCNVYLEGE